MFALLYKNQDNELWWNKVGLWGKRREQATAFGSVKDIKQHFESVKRKKPDLFFGKLNNNFFAINLNNNQISGLSEVPGIMYQAQPRPNSPYVLVVTEGDNLKYYFPKENTFKIDGSKEGVSYFDNITTAKLKAQNLGEKVQVYDTVLNKIVWKQDGSVDLTENYFEDDDKDIDFSLEKTKEALDYLQKALKYRLPQLRQTQSDFDSKFQEDMLHAIEFEDIADPNAFIQAFKAMRQQRRKVKDEQAILSALENAFDVSRYNSLLGSFGVIENRKYTYRTEEISKLIGR